MDFLIFANNIVMQQEIVTPSDYKITRPIAEETALQSAMQTVSQEIENTATSVALMHEKVVGAKCFTLDNALVVAVILQPIYLKSERDCCLNEIKTTVESKTSVTTLVTTDIDVYTKIKSEMTIEHKAALYKKVTDRL